MPFKQWKDGDEMSYANELHPAEEIMQRFDMGITANWLLRKLGNIEAERRRIKDQYEAIVNGLDSEQTSLENMFKPQLEQFCKLQLENEEKKNLKFLQGTCSFRTIPKSVKITNSDEALEYAVKNKDDYMGLIDEVTNYVLDRDGYRDIAEAALAETGEILPGIEFVPARESFSIKFGGDK